MVFINNGIIATRVTEHEPLEIECICTTIKISKKHWLIFSIYQLRELYSSFTSGNRQSN